MVSPDEIAKAATLRASDDSSLITGMELSVDGAWRNSMEWTAGIWPGPWIIPTTRENDTWASPLDRRQAVFPKGACLASFCNSNANPRPPHRRCGALQKNQAYNYTYVMGPNQR
jgi:hypothetical protein